VCDDITEDWPRTLRLAPLDFQYLGNPDLTEGVGNEQGHREANPGEHAEKLAGVPFTVVDNDGSPQGKKDFVFWNPPLLDEAKKDHVNKFIYVSVLNAHQMKDLKVIQAKELFVTKLKESGLDYVVIRPTGFFSDMLEFLKMARKGKISLFGNGQNKINPIHGVDLAEVCVSLLDKSEKEINIGGPEILTYKEIAELAFSTLNKKPKIATLPVWAIRIILPIMRTFTSSGTYGPVEFMMSVMTMDVVGDKYGKERLENFFRQAPLD